MMTRVAMALKLTSLPGFPEGPGGPRGPIGPYHKAKPPVIYLHI